MSAEKVKIQVPAGHRLITESLIRTGLEAAAEALSAQDCKLPGFQFAKALVDKELADQRAVCNNATLRFAAPHGDIASAKVVYFGQDEKDLGFYVEVVPGDLVDEMEAGQ